MLSAAPELKEFANRHAIPQSIIEGLSAIPSETLEELCMVIVHLLERSAAGLQTTIAEGDDVTPSGASIAGMPTQTLAEGTVLEDTAIEGANALDEMVVPEALDETQGLADSSSEPTLNAESRGRGDLPTTLRSRRTLSEELANSLSGPPGGWEMVSLDALMTSDTLFLDEDEEREDLGDRYEDLGVLGVGGMGEVRRVRDRDLGRRLAMKIIKPELMKKPKTLARFLEEAQVGAQLQHPGVIPVHEIDRLPDGRVYFTMREIKGREFGEVIEEVHEASQGDAWKVSPSGWTFWRLISALQWVCETVGYAHARGVVHRDLKPANIMVGRNEEVLVVDWGIAKVLGRVRHEALEDEAVETARSRDDSQATRLGAITGTLAYMPLEQAAGEIDKIDARSDVYALGSVLYEILSGRAPYQSYSAAGLLTQIAKGPPQSVTAASAWPLPPALVDLCERAMQREQAGRYTNAQEMAGALGSWLEGVKRREKALEVIEQAREMQEEIETLKVRAQDLRAQGTRLLEGIPGWKEEEDKHAGWAAEDEAETIEREVESKATQVEQTLQLALTHAPELEETHAALAALYQSQHQAAEAVRDERVALRAETLLRTHSKALPQGSMVRQGFLSYLKGVGALTLVTNPPGADVKLFRYEKRHRRLHPVFVRDLGRTPFVEIPLERGSYLLELHKDGHDLVRYPVAIGRGEHWHGVRPGASEPFAIALSPTGYLRPDERYVTAGWFWAGGDPGTLDSFPRRRYWVDPFVVSRFPITNAKYIAFLDDLVAQGREEEALRHVPRERAGTVGEQGAMSYGYERGRFFVRPDADGDFWMLPQAPAVQIDWYGAQAYCEWLAVREGREWRLPCELEWEKAARGVDGRFFPWGDVLDPSWCCMRQSHGRWSYPVPREVSEFAGDVSPYGVRGLAGNVQDWCVDVFQKNPPKAALAFSGAAICQRDSESGADRVVRGGAWSSSAKYCRVAVRFSGTLSARNVHHGARPVRSFSQKNVMHQGRV